MIKRSKNNDEMPDFEEVMNDVEQEVEADKAEQEIIDRIPQLQQFVKNVDLATNTFINSTLELENAINMYLRAEDKFQGAVNTISGKVATINTHIDNVLKEAPKKLKVTVEVRSEDWQKIEKMFDDHNKKILGMMQGNTIRSMICLPMNVRLFGGGIRNTMVFISAAMPNGL